MGTFAGQRCAHTGPRCDRIAECFRSWHPPAVLGVDDAHLLDDLSTFVLHQIVQRRAAKVILTVCDDEPVPPSIREVWKSGQLDRLDLQPLAKDETAQLVAAALGGPVDPAAAHRLWDLTRGNLLYLRNIVEHEVAAGRITQHHGVWRWTGEPLVPRGLVELVETRIGALAEPVMDVLDALAVGEPLELTSLRRIVEPAAIEEADMRGLITLETGDGGVDVRMAHPLYGEVRRKRAATTRLRRLRGLVATELARLDRGDDIRTVVRRAALTLDSDLTPDPDLFLAAAHRATWLGDLALADRLAEAAASAGAGLDANIIRARALAWSGRGREAEAVLAAIDANSLTDTDRATLVFLRGSTVIWALNEPTRAKKLADDASHTIAPACRSCVDALYTVYWATAGKPEEATRSSKDLVVEQLPGVVGAELPWAMVLSAGETGRGTDAIAAANAGYVIANRSFDAAYMGLAIADAHVTALLLCGRIAEAHQLTQQLSARTGEIPGGANFLGAGLAGRATLAAGRLDAACRLLEPVVESLFSAETSGGFYGFGYRYQHPRAIALAIRGEVDDAAAALRTLDEQQLASWQYLDYERALARAWIAAAKGLVSEAITSAISAAQAARADGRFAVEVMCLQTATQFGDPSHGRRLRELTTTVEGPRVGLAAEFATALGSGDADELLALSEAFESMGDLVAAVDAAAHAATAYRRRNLRGSAYRCATRAQELAERCGGARTPALSQTADRVPLTSREREIGILIGEGFSSRAVADRLSLSVRTVENHIYRAMVKTGATSREELAAMAGYDCGHCQ